MSVATSNLQVLVEHPVACIKVIGRGNFNVSASFEKLLEQLQRTNTQRYVMELSECLLMDSSFLGVLVGFAAKLQEANGAAEPPAVELHNPTPTVMRLFEDLNVLELFRVTHGAAPALDGASTQVLPGECTKEETTRACLEAHLALMRQNPENARRFKDVAKFLAEDLQKLQGP